MESLVLPLELFQQVLKLRLGLISSYLRTLTQSKFVSASSSPGMFYMLIAGEEPCCTKWQWPFSSATMIKTLISTCVTRPGKLSQRLLRI